MEDTNVSVAASDVEALLNRVANVRYIWYNPCNVLVMNESGGQSPTHADWENGSNVSGSSGQGDGCFSQVDKKALPHSPSGRNVRSKANCFQPRGRSEKGQPRKAFDGDSYTVTISSRERVAASRPLGFHDINMSGSSNAAKARRKEKPMICNFCKNNRELRDIYLTHYLYDPVTKVLACPVLRKHICEVCGDTGDYAHTLQYCRINRERGGNLGNVPKMLSTHSVTNSAGKIRKN